jgi:hypothetical protein
MIMECRRNCRHSCIARSPVTATSSGTSGEGRDRTRIPGTFGSAEFLAAYDAAIGSGAKAHKSPPSGTFAWALHMSAEAKLGAC